MLRSFVSAVILAAMGLALLSVVSSGAHENHIKKLSPRVREVLDGRAPDKSVLVIMKNQADLSHLPEAQDRKTRITQVYDALRNIALEDQKDIRAFLDLKHARYRAHYIFNALTIYSPSSDLINILASRDDVARIVGNPNVKMQPPVKHYNGAKGQGIESNITHAGAARVWEELGIRGQNIVVAGQDTGVDWKHPALRRQYRGSRGQQNAIHDFNWHDAVHEPIEGNKGNPCGYNSVVPCDDDQHGTHTMGTMVGEDGSDNRIGMAPEAQWIACRNMDRGTGTPSTYIECFEFFLAPYPIHGNPMTDGDPSLAPHIINNSWGCPFSEGCEGNEIIPALKAMKAAGIMVVVSAGNDGPNCSTINDQPASIADYVLSVGALDHRASEIADFSSRGPTATERKIGPDVVAPGVNIRSSTPGGGFEGFFWSGTSMAAPHVSGLVALLWSAQPALEGKIDETRALIRKTAHPKTSKQTCSGTSGSQIPNNTYGFGIIDAYESVKSAL